jgi:hypothetical protein
MVEHILLVTSDGSRYFADIKTNHGAPAQWAVPANSADAPEELRGKVFRPSRHIDDGARIPIWYEC